MAGVACWLNDFRPSPSLLPFEIHALPILQVSFLDQGSARMYLGSKTHVHIELSIDSASYDFGSITGGGGSASADDAQSLTISSNTDWTLSFSVAGFGSDRLLVSLSSTSGSGNAVVSAGYSLFDLRSMTPGDYTAAVTYTVEAE